MEFDFGRVLAGQKAIADHPALHGSQPVSVYSPGATRKDARLSQREAGRHMEAYGGPQAIDHVYDAIQLYADPTATAPYALEREDGTKLVRAKTPGTPPEYEVGPRPLYDLLDRPNPYMLYDQLMTLLVIDLLLVGNAYWLKYRQNDQAQPLALYRLAPSHVKIIPDAFGPKKYEYQPPGASKPIKLGLGEVMHFKRANPHDGYYGLGVIQGAGRTMDLELAITDTMASYYENRADPSLIIQSERRVPRDVFKKLRMQLRNRLAGSHKAGELLVLEAGLKASSLSPSARDALFAELSKMSRDRVFQKFHTSPMLYGIMDESSGSNKVSDFRREFDNYTLRPFLDRLQRLVSEQLAKAYGCLFFIKHRYVLPPDEAVKVNESIAKVPGIKVREIRRQYEQFGIEESTGDTDIDEMVLNLPGEELGPDGQPVKGGAGFPDRPLGSEAGRPPKGENTKPITRNLPAGAKARPSGKALTDHIDLQLQLIEDRARILKTEGKALVNADGSRATVGNKLQGERRPSDPNAAGRKNDIDSAMTFMEASLADAARVLERGLLDHVEGKAFKKEDLVKRIRQSPSWKVFKDMVDQTLMEGARRAISAAVMSQSDSGRTPDDDIDYDEIAASVVRRPEGVRGIVKTLKDRVAMRVQRALSKDEPIQAVIQGEVQEVIRAWSTNQAQMIADSEATEAYNEATLTVAELTGSTDVFVVEDDDAPDEPCQEARDSVWSIEFARQHRKEHPRCRRSFVPLEPETA